MTLHLDEFPVELPGHGTGPLHQRRRRLAARAEGDVRRRPGVLGRPPDLPGGLDGRLPHGRPADARPRARTPCSRATVRPAAATRWAGCSTTSRAYVDWIEELAARVVRRRADAARGRAEGTPAARTPTGRRASGWSATCTAPTPSSTRLRAAGPAAHPRPVARDGRPPRRPDRLPRLIAGCSEPVRPRTHLDRTLRQHHLGDTARRDGDRQLERLPQRPGHRDPAVR